MRAPAAAALAACLSLVACEQKGPQTTSTTSAEPSHRYTVIPASTTPDRVGANLLFYAWRLDTTTGELWLCTYLSGTGQVTNGKVDPERLTCAVSEKPNGPGGPG